MVSSVKLILALSVLATFACTGYAIRCHYCTSVDSDCGRNKSFIVDCTEGYKSSLLGSIFLAVTETPTSCQKISYTKNGKTVNARGCKTAIDACAIVTKKVYPIPVNCAYCNENECNESFTTVPIAGTILFFFGVARLLA
ncbi:uncharacterized protein LOC121529676 [Drosophila eugracilis]|uniref:uncharacterized protein LOC121529676 n=1 Tax=Drosophila eugracilis TaxID=29029 RepID=UPI0007E82DEB|nr:uncharacterized protein LOC121529676 [Drosophila eugracilis]